MACEQWHVPVYLHAADLPLFVRGKKAALYGLPFEQPDEPDHYIADGDTLRVGSAESACFTRRDTRRGTSSLTHGRTMFGGDLSLPGPSAARICCSPIRCAWRSPRESLRARRRHAGPSRPRSLDDHRSRARHESVSERRCANRSAPACDAPIGAGADSTGDARHLARRRRVFQHRCAPALFAASVTHAGRRSGWATAPRNSLFGMPVAVVVAVTQFRAQSAWSRRGRETAAAIMIASCAIAQLIIAPRIERLRGEIGGPIEILLGRRRAPRRVRSAPRRERRLARPRDALRPSSSSSCRARTLSSSDRRFHTL